MQHCECIELRNYCFSGRSLYYVQINSFKFLHVVELVNYKIILNVEARRMFFRSVDFHLLLVCSMH